MNTYKWNAKEIREKQRYVIKRLKNCDDLDERAKLLASLCTYVTLLNNQINIRRFNITKFFDKNIACKYRLYKGEKQFKETDDFMNVENHFMDKEYLSFLLDLAQNVYSGNYVNENIEFETINLPFKQLEDISLDFYKSLGDEKLYNLAKDILNTKNMIQFQDYIGKDLGSVYGGMTYYDAVFNESYIALTNNHNLADVWCFNHELTHAIDFKCRQKVPGTYYYGFQELPTHTIDYLMIDYLEKSGFDSTEVDKIRTMKNKNIKYNAYLICEGIKKMLESKKGMPVEGKINTDDVMELMTFDIKKKLLEIETDVISYYLAEQYHLKPELGLQNIKKVIGLSLPINQRPNFSVIGLDDETLLETSKIMGQEKLKVR